ncbi:MAG: O-antigen ligase family protein [Terriglobia bacterium]
MPPQIATAIFAVGIAGLFLLDRDKSVHTSKALWLPVTWLGIVGSRPVSGWLGIAPPAGLNTQLDGSPVDRLVFQLLLVAGIIVLIRRSSRTTAFLKASWPILLYFSYCLLSVLWSDFPDVSFKRWIKAIGDLVMVLVVVTDAEPAAALRRLLSRTGFVLLPASILLIKYFGDLGRGYTPDGMPMNTGVTTNKNMLGVITLVLCLGAFWRVQTLFRAKGEPGRDRHLLAQCILLAVGVAVLAMAQSATSLACFALGSALMLATQFPAIKRRPGAVHALVLMIILAGGLTMLLGGEAGVVHALGRKTNFTGRTEIWAAVLPAVPNRMVGAGFESFWIGPWLARVYSGLSQYMHVNEAHNGYIEVYLNLGWVGVSLIAIILISGYRRAVAALRRDPAMGSLMLAYLAAAAVYSITEAGFRLLDPIWIFLLLAIVAAGGIASGVIGGAPEPPGAPADQTADLLTAETDAPDHVWSDH